MSELDNSLNENNLLLQQDDTFLDHNKAAQFIGNKILEFSKGCDDNSTQEEHFLMQFVMLRCLLPLLPRMRCKETNCQISYVFSLDGIRCHYLAFRRRLKYDSVKKKSLQNVLCVHTHRRGAAYDINPIKPRGGGHWGVPKPANPDKNLE